MSCPFAGWARLESVCPGTGVETRITRMKTKTAPRTWSIALAPQASLDPTRFGVPFSFSSALFAFQPPLPYGRAMLRRTRNQDLTAHHSTWANQSFYGPLPDLIPQE